MRTGIVSSAAVLLAACGGLGVSPDQLRGTSGPVAWEVVDVSHGVLPDERKIRWEYTVVLRETAGVGIQFETQELGGGAYFTSTGLPQTSFRRRLEPQAELRIRRTHTVEQSRFGAFGREEARFFLTYSGVTDTGKPVSVLVLVALDRSASTKPAAAPPPPPPAARPEPTPAPPPPMARPAPDPTRLARAAALEEEARRLLEDGRFADALPRAREATSIREEGLEQDNLDLATSRSTLAEIYRGQGNAAEAESLHAQALAAREKRLGDTHPDVARSLHSLGLLQHSQGRYLEAESLLRRATGILDAHVGKDSRDRRLHAEILDGLAKVYRALGKTRDAEEAQARAAVLWTQQ